MKLTTVLGFRRAWVRDVLGKSWAKMVWSYEGVLLNNYQSISSAKGYRLG